MADLFRSSQGLVEALMGGDAIEAGARQTQELQNLAVGKGQADFARKVDEARMAAQKRVARENTANALRQTLPEGMRGQADALADLSLGYATNFNDLGGGVGKFQTNDMRGQVAPALEADGFTPANALLGAMDGKPIENVKIQGGYELGKRFGASPSISATPGELADIANTNRRTANVGVSSGGGSGSPGKAGAFTTPPNNRLVSALGGEGSYPDPERTQEFLRWQKENAAVDPAYRDGDYALSAYLAGDNAMRPETNDFGAGPVRLPASVDPADVEMLKQIELARRAEGLPPMTHADRVNAYKQIKNTGGYKDMSTAAKPAGDGGIIDSTLDAITGFFGNKKPADKQKGNAGVESSGVAAPETAKYLQVKEMNGQRFGQIGPGQWEVLP